MHLHFCALFPVSIRHSDAVKLIKYLPVLASIMMFVTAMATGLVGHERSDVPEFGGLFPAYEFNSKPKLWRPT